MKLNMAVKLPKILKYLSESIFRLEISQERRLFDDFYARIISDWYDNEQVCLISIASSSLQEFYHHGLKPINHVVGYFVIYGLI